MMLSGDFDWSQRNRYLLNTLVDVINIRPHRRHQGKERRSLLPWLLGKYVKVSGIRFQD